MFCRFYCSSILTISCRFTVGSGGARRASWWTWGWWSPLMAVLADFPTGIRSGAMMRRYLLAYSVASAFKIFCVLLAFLMSHFLSFTNFKHEMGCHSIWNYGYPLVFFNASPNNWWLLVASFFETYALLF